MALVSLPLLERIWTFLRTHVRPAQVCWVCVGATLGIGWFMTANFAPAAELDKTRTDFTRELATLRSDVGRMESDRLAKDLYDFQARICASTADKRWLREQMSAKQERFRALNGGRDYQLPGCGDL